MSTDPLLGGSRAPAHAPGKDIDALGPSDSSDSGSDVQTDLRRTSLPDEGSEGALPIAHDSSSDAAGTGETASADPAPPELDADLLPDRTGQLPGEATDDVDVATADSLADDDEDESAA
jgi:hypothetical protein